MGVHHCLVRHAQSLFRHVYDVILPIFCTKLAAPFLQAIPLRLVKDGLMSSSEGRVEIKYNEVWGTVCDDYWDIGDATVVCRMLEFSQATAAYRRAKFGRGRGKIWLSHLMCKGEERSLLECSHRGLGRHMCGHREDAGVTCEGKNT